MAGLGSLCKPVNSFSFAGKVGIRRSVSNIACSVKKKGAYYMVMKETKKTCTIEQLFVFFNCNLVPPIQRHRWFSRGLQPHFILHPLLGFQGALNIPISVLEILLWF
ncbi:Uncharacterized protein TCM_037674 [Theobroma cacao]|uniref:Uncharacterized protein n=1 Tax=Theobroma cacao TaxID=3641 RepID=A0A061GLR1_THECC|nr:Uncharacterized protein TCM_037674 [Theobroma cacao]